jgi:pyrroloquinoline quinone (PQQ) biosynthesis protein C
MRRLKTFRQVIESDSERYVKKEAKRLAKENGWDKIHTLSYLRTKYERENRSEEAAIVTKVISEEEANEIREYDDD